MSRAASAAAAPPLRLAAAFAVLLGIGLAIFPLSSAYAQAGFRLPDRFEKAAAKGRPLSLPFASQPPVASPDAAAKASVAAWMWKVDPLLMRAHMEHTLGLAPSSAQLKSPDNRVKIFLQFAPGEDPETIPGFTLTSRSPRGAIATGYVDLMRINEIASRPGVLKMESSKLLRPLHVNSRRLIGVDKVHSGEGLPSAYKGEGVYVGVLDSGIDFDHPDFTDEQGTRIQFLFEWMATQAEIEVWNKQQIDNTPEVVTQIDGAGGMGHGTHVAATAAGGGRASSEYTGMAPKSDILFVKGVRDHQSDGGFFDADVIEGVNYMFEIGRQLEQPTVVNLSLGGNSGPLDGTSLYEQYMTLLQGDGRIIVAAAGNEGFDYIHAGATLQKENTVAIWHYPDNDMEMFNEIWYEKGAISNYRVAAIGVNDDGLYLAGYSDWQSVNTSNLDEERGLEIMDLATESPAGYLFHHSLNSEDMYNGDGQIYLKVWDGYEANSGLPYSAINDYIWVTFLFSGGDGGRFDMTVNSGATLPTEPGPFGVTFIPGDRDHSVGTPATSDSVISVGAFVSTNAWDVPGEGTYSLQYPADINWTTAYTPAIGEAAYFSSRGPTRDGRLAPVISAPGDKIFSARSFDIPDEVYPGTGMFLRENGHYVTMQGTSMAAPHITGIIALMLQIDPTLNYGDIVDIFSRSVTTDELTGAGPNNIYGYGRIDAHKAVKNTLQATYNETFDRLPERVELMANYPNPFNPSTTIAFLLPSATHVTIDVFNALGQRVATLADGVLAAGYHSMDFDAAGMASGVYLYRITTPGFTQTRTMTLLK